MRGDSQESGWKPCASGDLSRAIRAIRAQRQAHQASQIAGVTTVVLFVAVTVAVYWFDRPAGSQLGGPAVAQPAPAATEQTLASHAGASTIPAQGPLAPSILGENSLTVGDCQDKRTKCPTKAREELLAESARSNGTGVAANAGQVTTGPPSSAGGELALPIPSPHGAPPQGAGPSREGPAVAAMGCRDVKRLASQYLTHALPAEQASQLEQHLRRCPPCLKIVEQARNEISCRQRLSPPVVAAR